MSGLHLFLYAVVVCSSRGPLEGAPSHHSPSVRYNLQHPPSPLLRGIALTLRGGGKKRRAKEDSEKSRESKRTRDEKVSGNHVSDDGETSDESVDDLEYKAAPQGSGFGLEPGLHPLGTVPMKVSGTDVACRGGPESKSEDSSLSFPGCLEGVSEEDGEEEAAEEEVEEEAGPLPTREELVQRIRDRPFNASFVRLHSVTLSTFPFQHCFLIWHLVATVPSDHVPPPFDI